MQAQTTKKAAHTAGPWVASDCYVMTGATTLASCVAMCDVEGDISPEEEIANARLIAAAPDLLAAVTAIVEFEARPDFTLWPKRIDAARAAIVKATGAA